MIFATSTAAIFNKDQINVDLVDFMKYLQSSGVIVAVISNHNIPAWFNTNFGNSGVQFVKQIGRQSGEVIQLNAEKLGFQSYDTLVLAANKEDVQMGKNSGAVLIAAGWSSDREVSALGIQARNVNELSEVVHLMRQWNQGGWYYSNNNSRYAVKALSNLSGKGGSITVAQSEFSRLITNTAKNGGTKLNALLAITAKSLLIDQVQNVQDLMWGVYPSSSSNNQDNEVLSNFCHRLRTTVSRVRYAKVGQPLFIRHTPSEKRSASRSSNREDPTGQILTIHLNSTYAQSIHGRHVIVLDDCTTYGVSFGVAAAFLYQAGAASVTGIALGKFGNRLNYYNIDLNGNNPFAPIPPNSFNYCHQELSTNFNNQLVQRSLIELLS